MLNGILWKLKLNPVIIAVILVIATIIRNGNIATIVRIPVVLTITTTKAARGIHPRHDAQVSSHLFASLLCMVGINFKGRNLESRVLGVGVWEISCVRLYCYGYGFNALGLKFRFGKN